jgi:hypothetical protein
VRGHEDRCGHEITVTFPCSTYMKRLWEIGVLRRPRVRTEIRARNDEKGGLHALRRNFGTIFQVSIPPLLLPTTCLSLEFRWTTLTPCSQRLIGVIGAADL